MRNRLYIWAGVIIFGSLLWGCSEDKTTEPIPDTTPPEVTTTFPAAGDTGVGVDIHLQVGFSEAMSMSTLTSQTIYIDNLGGSTVLASSRSATLIPAQDLEYSHEYTATVTTNVRDAAGNRLAQNYHWTFTTGADTTRPIVFLTDPADGAVDVPNYFITIRVLMSKPIDPASVTNATFYLDGGTFGAVETRWDTLIFIPEDTLFSNQTYTATLTTGITDTLGNALAADYSWSFTTGSSLIIMPLSVGNTWDYDVITSDSSGSVNTYTQTLTLTTTMTVGDEIWYVGDNDRRYIGRSDGLWEYRYNEFLAAAAPGKLNDSAYVGWYPLPATVRLVAKDTLITVPAGDFICDKYEGNGWDMMWQYRYRVYYAKNVGMVQFEKKNLSSFEALTEKLSSYSIT